MAMRKRHGGDARRTVAMIAATGACALMFGAPSVAMAADTPTAPLAISGTSDLLSSAGSPAGTPASDATTRSLGDVIGHIHDTNTQIKQDIVTSHEHAEQLHQQIHQDANDLRQHHEQAWQDLQQTHDDIKDAVGGAYDRAHERHEILHQDMVDTQHHMNQLHADLKTEHDLVKQQHLQWVAARDQWHKDLQNALRGSLGNGSGLNGGSGSGLNGTGSALNAGTSGGSNGSTGTTGTVTTASNTAGATNGSTSTSSTSNTASGDSNGAATVADSLQDGQLAVTGVGAPAALSAATVGLLMTAALLKTVEQYRRETSDR